ncbi:hypothetical protein V8G54_013320 [Vigna mungo]|uniref:Uncharacterized protein n=1 Tax=Vigna mungo TaxID=3915 RepID=A0AAQ3S4T9_VIGMU
MTAEVKCWDKLAIVSVVMEVFLLQCLSSMEDATVSWRRMEVVLEKDDSSRELLWLLTAAICDEETLFIEGENLIPVLALCLAFSLQALRPNRKIHLCDFYRYSENVVHHCSYSDPHILKLHGAFHSPVLASLSTQSKDLTPPILERSFPLKSPPLAF